MYSFFIPIEILLMVVEYTVHSTTFLLQNLSFTCLQLYIIKIVGILLVLLCTDLYYVKNVQIIYTRRGL